MTRKLTVLQRYWHCSHKFETSVAAVVRQRSVTLMCRSHHTNTPLFLLGVDSRNQYCKHQGFCGITTEQKYLASFSGNGGANELQGHYYQQVGGPIDPSICNLTENEIHCMLRERMKLRERKDYVRMNEMLKELHKARVQVDDYTMEWRADGVQMTSIRTRTMKRRRNLGHLYKQVGGPVDPSICKLTDAEIHRMLSERLEAKLQKDYERADALQIKLINARVQFDDYSKEWRADGVKMTSVHDRDIQRRNKMFGHYYKQVGGPVDPSVCTLCEVEIGRLLRERMEARNKKDFKRADLLLKELHKARVQVDDYKREWRADGVQMTSVYTSRTMQRYPERLDKGAASTEPPSITFDKSLGDAVDTLHSRIGSLTRSNISAFWTSVPKLLRHEGKLINPHERKRQVHDRISKILNVTLEQFHAFEPRHIAQITLGIAKTVRLVDRDNTKLLEGSLHQVLRDIFIGKDSLKKGEILDRIAADATPILHDFNPRSLSNLIYAFGLARHVPECGSGRKFFDAVALAAMPNLHNFNGQDISNMLWAYATVGISNHDLFQRVGDHVVELDNIQDFNPQSLSNIVFSYATSNESHPKLFQRVADHIVQLGNVTNFNGQDCSNTVWAYATAVVPHPRLYERIGDHIVELADVRGFAPQAFSNIVWAYATAKESHPKLFQKIADAVISKGRKFSPQQIATFLLAYATNGEIDQKIFQELAPRAEALVEDCNGQDLANIAWAYAVADVDAPSLFNHAFLNACSEKNQDFTREGLSQLHQWNLWQEEIKSDIRLPRSLENRCLKAFLSRAPEPSGFQNDVIFELASIGLKPKEEALTDRGYRLDAFVGVNSIEVGLEVDGPHHFTRAGTPSGNTMLKRRQLANLEGIPVVSVPYWEWRGLGKNRHNKQQYLRKLLEC